MRRKSSGGNMRFARRFRGDFSGFSEAAAGNLLGYSGEYVGALKDGDVVFTPEIIRHLADRTPEKLAGFWKKVVADYDKYGEP